VFYGSDGLLLVTSSDNGQCKAANRELLTATKIALHSLDLGSPSACVEFWLKYVEWTAFNEFWGFYTGITQKKHAKRAGIILRHLLLADK
jgi:hypothetical protein